MLISPPGDTILETIETLGMSQVELAERLGKPKEVVNKLIKGTEPISSATAYKLQMALGIEAGFWINRESRYRYQLFLRKKEKENEQQKTWLKRFPLRQLKANNLIPKSATTSENLDALLAFFGVGSVEQWERIYMAQEVSVAFRISLASTKCPYALSTWLRLGEKQATGLALADYNKVDFRSSLDSIKELAFQQSVDFQLRLQETCATSGVAVVFTPNLPKAPVSGATRWYRGNPLIQLSGRYKTDDHFWCTFFHEAAHVLLHGKKDVFLEDVSGVKPNEAKEAEANAFASRFLIPDKDYAALVDALAENPKHLDQTVCHFSEILRVPPGIIVGRLQHDGHLTYRQGNGFKQKIALQF